MKRKKKPKKLFRDVSKKGLVEKMAKMHAPVADWPKMEKGIIRARLG